MLRRRHINADPRGRSMRFLRGLGDVARWPFERVAWLLERRLVWPLRERTAGLVPSRRVAGGSALLAIAAAAVAAGLLLVPRDDESHRTAAEPARVAIATPPPGPQAERPQGPALRGAPPSFGIDEGVGVSKAESGEASGADAESSGETPEAGAEPAQPETAGATTSSKKPVPAGPAAMKVARRFAQAFVFYEVGEQGARSKTVFGETATPQLATALTERPPRLPEDAKVPKARVVNLVPGPRAGKAYTVSVSLLRVGLTSELRLEIRNKDGTWFVTDVRG